MRYISESFNKGFVCVYIFYCQQRPHFDSTYSVLHELNEVHQTRIIMQEDFWAIETFEITKD